MAFSVTSRHCQSTNLNEVLSIDNITKDTKRNTDYFTKILYFKPTFQISKYTNGQQKLLKTFIF